MPSAPSRALDRILWILVALSVAPTLVACAESAALTRDRDDDASVAPREDGGGAPDAGASDAASESTDASTPLDTPPAAPDAGPPAMACPRIRVVTPGEMLNIRPSPSTAMAAIGTLPDGAIAEVVSAVHGESIGGVDVWYEIRRSSGTGFVFSSFARCTDDPLPTVSGYYVPFACGASVRVTQSPGGGVSHTGRSMYAFDFAAALNTEIRAMAPGRVTLVSTATGPGDPCYNGGDASCGSAANLVIIEHADGTTAAYKHINSATVSVGATVQRGDVIARSGSTGHSTGPHLHVEVRNGCPTTVYCNTIPFSYTDVGTPRAPVTVTSGNCH
jgi:murein DD-endopeptidase MepM/ murein hydrolase activator NlpD